LAPGGEEQGPEVASQRKPLALLAILAAAAPHGASRDRLLLLLWPDSHTERARGALKTMVHALRKQLGPEVVEGVAELQLGSSVVASDIGRFRAALASGDDAAAVAAYGGPFLDGVYLDAAPEFERWASDERARLHGELRDALERLAARASSEGQLTDAVRWWRARHAADPLHAPTSLRFMRALAAAGDRAGALLHARAHESLVRSELDVAADPEVLGFAETLRAGGDLELAATGRDVPNTPPGPPSIVPCIAPGSPAVADTREGRAAMVEPASRPALYRRWPVIGALALAAFALGFTTLNLRRDRSSDTATASALQANRVAVAVFVNRTGVRALDVLGTMSSDWVTRGLAQTPGAEVFDIGGLFLSGRAPDGAAVDPRELARANGAGLVVAGNYYKVGSRIAFSVQLLDVASGRVVRALGPVEGDADQPLAAVEEMRQQVASAVAISLDPRLGELTRVQLVPPRYDAYTEFAAGQEIYWRGDWEAALPHFRRAVALDSNFMAALAFVSVAAVGTGRCALVDSVLQRYGARRPPPNDLDWLTVQVSRARCESNHEEHNRLVRERLALMRGSRFVTMVLSTGYRQLNRPSEALALLADVIHSRDLGWLPQAGRAFYWRELAANNHLLHDYASERGVADQMAAAGVHRLTTTYVRARALAGLGHGDSAVALMDGIAGLSPDPALVAGTTGLLPPMQVATPGWVMYQVALELAAHGDSVAARGVMERSAHWFASARQTEPVPLAPTVVYTRVLEWLGRGQEARSIADALAIRESTSIHARGSLGLVAANAGDADAALRADRWLEEQPPRFPKGLPILYRAQIAAALGDTARAGVMLRALPHAAHPLDVVHFHTDPSLARLRASETMRRWMVPRG
jgi:DNA-binding SARP family transcriptional activator/TolB-like protein